MEGLGLIIALIIGAISLFSGQKENSQRKARPVARPTPTPSGRTYDEQVSPQMNRNDKEIQSKPLEVELSKYEINSHQNTFNENKTGGNTTETQLKRPKNNSNNTMGLTSVSVKNQLTKKRIAESLIMKEVLGAPRAHNPFSFDYKHKTK